MAKWFFFGFAAAAAFAAYMFWFRRSDDFNEGFDSVRSKAKDYTSSMFDRASDVTEGMKSRANDQISRAREMANV